MKHRLSESIDAHSLEPKKGRNANLSHDLIGHDCPQYAISEVVQADSQILNQPLLRCLHEEANPNPDAPEISSEGNLL